MAHSYVTVTDIHPLPLPQSFSLLRISLRFLSPSSMKLKKWQETWQCKVLVLQFSTVFFGFARISRGCCREQNRSSLCTNLYWPDLLQWCWPQEEENWNGPPTNKIKNNYPLFENTVVTVDSVHCTLEKTLTEYLRWPNTVLKSLYLIHHYF